MIDSLVGIEKILRFGLFKDFEKNPEALQVLASLMKRVVFETRDLIIDEKQSDDRMFFLLNGEVHINKVDDRGNIVIIGRANSKQNPYFGESILLGKFRKSANVIAHGRCECLSLSTSDFEVLTQKFPSLMASLYRSIAAVLFERLMKANQDLLILGTLSKG